MTAVKFTAMPTEDAIALWAGGPDAQGLRPETHISDGDGMPCRHCLGDVAEGEPFLILSYRPFDKAQPYAETGPVFLHAKSCGRYDREAEIPASFLERESYLLKGYCSEDRIVYGTGKHVSPGDMAAYAAELFEDPKIAYVHVRSSLNNCYSARIDRA